MPIDYQVAQIPLTGGLAQHVAPALVQSGKLHTATNAVIRKQGSVEMRPGTVALGNAFLTDIPLENTRRIFANADETVVVTRDRLCTYAELADKWQDVDNCYEAVIKERIRGERGTAQVAEDGVVCDSVYCDGIYAVAWREDQDSLTTTETIHIRFMDAATKAKLFECSWTSGHYRVRLCAIGTRIYAFYWSTTAGVLLCNVWSITSLTSYGTVAVGPIGDSTSGFAFDATVAGSSLLVVYGYSSSAVPDSFRIAKWNAALTTVAYVQSTIVADNSYSSLAIAGSDNGRIFVASFFDYAGDGSLVWSSFSWSLVHLLDEAIPISTTVYGCYPKRLGICVDPDLPDERGLLTYDVYHIASVTLTETAYTVWHWFTDAGVADFDGGGVCYHAGLSSKPVIHDSKGYVCAHYHTKWGQAEVASGSRTYLVNDEFVYLLELRSDTPVSIDEKRTGPYGVPARVVTRIATWRAGWPGSEFAHVPNLQLVETDTYCVSVPMKSDTVNGLDEGFDLYRLEFDNRPHQSLCCSSIQGEPLLAGGVPACYDGVRCYELGFHYPPVIEAITLNNAGGQSGDGTYSVVAVYEWLDARGVFHQSMPSNPMSVTISAGTDTAVIVVTYAMLSLTERCDTANAVSPVQVSIYRTVADGEIYYLDRTFPNEPTDPNQTSYLTSIKDDDLETHTKLYTTGGVLEHVQPPACKHIIQHNNRLWMISSDDPEFLWASKLNRGAGGMPGFALDLIVRTDTDGPCTALASLDATLIIFKERSIFALAGEGPNDLGADSDMGAPRKISVAVGCVDARTVASIPAGVVFRAHDGIYLLGRDLGVSRISDAVEDYLTETDTVTSAVQVDQDSLVLFTVERTSDSSILAYHYAIGEWTVWWIPATDEDGSVASPGAAVCKRDELYRYHLLRDDGYTVHLDYSTGVDSNGLYYGYTVSSPWISMAGIQGYERVQFVGVQGTYVSPHTLTVSLYSDHDDSDVHVTTYSLDVSQIESLRQNLVEAIQCHVVNQDCRAIRVQIAVQPIGDPMTPVGVGRGVRLESLALEVGGERGMFRLPEIARF